MTKNRLRVMKRILPQNMQLPKEKKFLPTRNTRFFLTETSPVHEPDFLLKKRGLKTGFFWRPLAHHIPQKTCWHSTEELQLPSTKNWQSMAHQGQQWTKNTTTKAPAGGNIDYLGEGPRLKIVSFSWQLFWRLPACIFSVITPIVSAWTT